MYDAAQPTAAEVRAAAEAVKTALDRHLAAVERRSGEDDPAVYEAFNQLAAAAEAYDELLYDRYDEVTPFEIPAESILSTRLVAVASSLFRFATVVSMSSRCRRSRISEAAFTNVDTVDGVLGM